MDTNTMYRASTTRKCDPITGCATPLVFPVFRHRSLWLRACTWVTVAYFLWPPPQSNDLPLSGDDGVRHCLIDTALPNSPLCGSHHRRVVPLSSMTKSRDADTQCMEFGLRKSARVRGSPPFRPVISSR